LEGKKMSLKDENNKLQKKWDDLNLDHSKLMHRVGEMEERAQSQAQQIEVLKAELKEVSSSSIDRGEKIEGLSIHLDTADKLAVSRLVNYEASQKQLEELMLQNGVLVQTGIGYTQVIADLAAALKALTKT
jgi:chromosome segregation ATPase